MTGIAPTIGGRASPGGFTGATAAVRFAGGTVSGAPSTGSFLVGDFVVSNDGNVYVCVAAGTPGTWTCSTRDRSQIAVVADGFLSQNFNRLLGSTGTIFAASGAQYAFLVGLRAGDTVASMSMICTGTGVSLTLFKYGLYTKAGVLVASTADIKASVIVDTIVTGSFSTPYLVPADDAYYASAVMTHSGTAPTFLSATGISADAGLAKGANPRPSLRQTGLSDLATPLTVPGTASTVPYWVGVS
jgi:hypothetical protein